MSVKEQFKIVEHQKDDASYFYSDTDYTWHVVIVATGDALMEFSGYSNAGREGVTEGGVRSVYFDEAAGAVIAAHYDGTKEVCDLPVDVRITKDRKSVTLTYRDGKTEVRARRPVITTLKFGDTIVSSLIDPP